MPHNMTVTIDDTLWKKMKKHPEMRWGAVMKEAAREKAEALDVLKMAVEKNKLSEKEIEEFAIMLGRKINKAAARRLKIS